jgi:hypothetical protein
VEPLFFVPSRHCTIVLGERLEPLLTRLGSLETAAVAGGGWAGKWLLFLRPNVGTSKGGTLSVVLHKDATDDDVLKSCFQCHAIEAALARSSGGRRAVGSEHKHATSELDTAAQNYTTMAMRTRTGGTASKRDSTASEDITTALLEAAAESVEWFSVRLGVSLVGCQCSWLAADSPPLLNLLIFGFLTHYTTRQPSAWRSIHRFLTQRHQEHRYTKD